jgi:hypothetical protein
MNPGIDQKDGFLSGRSHGRIRKGPSARPLPG